jgi:eukaryotic-like serine/threonine-protein kinase
VSISVIGSAVLGYRIVSPLGVGGTGAVYLAEDPLRGRRVAVKIFHPRRAGDTAALDEYATELRAVQALAHPGIARVLETTTIATPAGDLPCVVMELLEGRTLAEVLDDDGPLAPARAVMVAEQVAEALAAAHASGICHHDLKAENVFLLCGQRALDRVKLLDFAVTRLGPVHGSPAYLSPEQCLGGSGGEATDVYAVGVLLYQMLAGRLPFRARGVGDLMLAHLVGEPPPPSLLRPGVPVALDAIVARALAKSPERRFGSMTGLLAALSDPAAFHETTLASAAASAPAAALAPAAPLAPPAAGAAPPLRPPARSSRLGMPAVLVAALGCLVALGSVLAAGERSRADDVTLVSPSAAMPPAVVVSVTVTTGVIGARVFLDDADLGPAGGVFAIPAGRPVELSVRAPGHHAFDRRIVAERDVHIEAVLLPRVAPAKPEA